MSQCKFSFPSQTPCPTPMISPLTQNYTKTMIKLVLSLPFNLLPPLFLEYIANQLQELHNENFKPPTLFYIAPPTCIPTIVT
jgi:hypothetical protein